MARVINKYKEAPTENSVYVGRGSAWGNPFTIGKDGSRSVVIERFRAETLPGLNVTELKGRDLVCFCAPQQCHADLLLEKANGE